MAVLSAPWGFIASLFNLRLGTLFRDGKKWNLIIQILSDIIGRSTISRIVVI